MTYSEARRWFADWIIQDKRRTRPHSLFVVGVWGDVGRGKSVFCERLAARLNRRLRPGEGKALARSLDDYYLSKSQRQAPEFLRRGYSASGISNRGPAGTHDVKRILQDIRAFEGSRSSSRIDLWVFDKQSDDRSPEPLRWRGRVGVLLLEGWFLGACTKVDLSRLPAGLKRSAAAALIRYRPVFDRLDALWAFESLPISKILAGRLEQQKTLDAQSGARAVTPAQVRRFVHYLYRDVWQAGVNSPLPQADRVSFWASMDPRRRRVGIKRRG